MLITKQLIKSLAYLIFKCKSTLVLFVLLFGASKGYSQVTEPKQSGADSPNTHAGIVQYKYDSTFIPKAYHCDTAFTPEKVILRGRISEQLCMAITPLPRTRLKVTINFMSYSVRTNDSGDYCIEIPVYFSGDSVYAEVTIINGSNKYAEIYLHCKQPLVTLNIVNTRMLCVTPVYRLAVRSMYCSHYSLTPKKQQLLIREAGKTIITRNGVTVYRYDNLNTLFDRTVTP